MPVSKSLRTRMKDAVKPAVAIPPDLAKKAEFSLVDVRVLGINLDNLKTITPDIATPDQYQDMDTYRLSVEKKMEEWAALVRPAIDPIKAGVLALEKLDRTVRKPLEELYEGAVQWMRHYKIAEASRAYEEQAKADRLRLEAQKKIAEATVAPNARARTRLVSQIVELEKEAQKVEDDVTVTVAENSDSRGKITWRLAGTQLRDDCEDHSKIPTESLETILKAVLDGTLPMEVLCINTKFINAQFKQNPAEVMEWPGFESYEDFIIARR